MDWCRLGNNPESPITSAIAGKPFKPAAKEVLPRPIISCLDSSQRRRLFKQLEKGYSELLRRSFDPPSNGNPANPTSLLYHMWLHWYNCSPPLSAHNVHHNWLFLPWHRAFIYFHERILQSIVGRDFRLPVWEWDQCNEVPPFFVEWAKSTACRYNSDNLEHQITPYILQAWLLSNSGDDFLGARNKTPNAAGGPHSLIHGTFGRIMSGPDTAALDPLFYTHHANVDRFWDYWRRSYRQFVDDPNWLKESFGFHDENGTPVTISVSDLMDLDALGYYYHLPPARGLIYNYGSVTPAETDPASRSVIFRSDDIRQILALELGVAAADVPSAIAESHDKLQGFVAPGRIAGIPRGAQNGQYYIVGMRGLDDKPDDKTTQIIGGFAVFMAPGMGDMETVAMCGFRANDLRYILNQKGRVQFVWGKPDSTLTAIAAGEQQPFWPVQASILFPK